MKCEPLCKSLYQHQRRRRKHPRARPPGRPPSHQPPPPPSRVAAVRIRAIGPTYPCSHALNACEFRLTGSIMDEPCVRSSHALTSFRGLLCTTDRQTVRHIGSALQGITNSRRTSHFREIVRRPEDASRNVKTVCWTGHECVDQSGRIQS